MSCIEKKHCLQGYSGMPNNGHFGVSRFVHSSEVVLFSEVGSMAIA